MTHVLAEAHTRATPTDVWKMWTDVAGSPAWDQDVDWSRLDGAFCPGTTGAFKLKEGPRLRFTLDRVELLRAYANTVRLPGLRLQFTHEMQSQSGQALLVRHGARIGGPLGWLLAPLLQKKLQSALQVALHNMVWLAERNAARQTGGGSSRDAA
jgi:hypothetical protein